VRLHPEPIRQPEPARDQANLHALYLRHRYHPDPLRHGGSQRYATFSHFYPFYMCNITNSLR
jgi:hypothetical protein